jgi:two-component system, OmpR family, response regulator VicR
LQKKTFYGRGKRMPKKILVVDDEMPIAEILKYNLEEEGYHVIVAFNGEEALQKVATEKPDLVILDIMMPQKDGYTACREIRQKSSIPIIMVTAREDEVDKVLGLELGADDYVTKPFSAREVVARVKAALRRVDMHTMADPQGPFLEFGRLTLSPEQAEVAKDGAPVNLTYREFALLQFFLRHPGHVFSREKLLNQVWGYDYVGDERTVDVTIRRIREKIEDDPASPDYICTRRGLGYYLRRP